MVKLLAFDADDLAIVSAQVHAGTVRAADLVYQPAARRFALAIDRFDWMACVEGNCGQRLAAALHLEHVTGVRSRGYAPDSGLDMTLLAITFRETDAPAGEVHLMFDRDICVMLSVECLEAVLKDIGAPRPAETPAPVLDDGAPS